MPLFFVVFFLWKNCAIVPSGHWALNTMTTNCDPMRCSHADHACYLDDDWRCHVQTGPGHMTNHEIFAHKTLLSVVLYFNVFGLRSSGAAYRRIHKSYCSRPIHAESLECLVCLVCQCLSWKTYTRCKKQNLKSETKLHILYVINWTTLVPWDWRTKL